MDEMMERALDELNDDQRLTFSRFIAGMDKLEGLLPESCTEESREAIGSVIKRARAAEKLAAKVFREAVAPSKEHIDRQRGLWKPLQERAIALVEKALGLVQVLNREKEAEREALERAQREKVAKAQREQAEAEAKALAAETVAEQAEAQKQADLKWNETRQAMSDLDRPAGDSVTKVGDASVFSVSRLDFDVTDIGAFATAHPELVSVRKGATLTALREALREHTTMPDEVPGFPGLKPKQVKKTQAR